MLSNQRTRSARPRTARTTDVASDVKEPRLHDTVIIGYADLLCVGCRALFGLDMGYHHHTLRIKELETDDITVRVQRPDTPNARQKYFSQFQILNCKYEEFSMIALNADVPPDRVHHLVGHLVGMCRKSKVTKVIALSCVRIEVPNQERVYENSFNCENVTDLPSIADLTLTRDPFLTTLIQMFKVVKIPLTVLSAASHQEPYNDISNSTLATDAIVKLQNIITENTGLLFNHKYSQSLILQKKEAYTMSMYS